MSITATVSEVYKKGSKLCVNIKYSSGDTEPFEIDASTVQSVSDISAAVQSRLALRNAIFDAGVLLIDTPVSLAAPVDIIIETNESKTFKVEAAYIEGKANEAIMANSSIARAELVTSISVMRVDDGISGLVSLNEYLAYKGLGA